VARGALASSERARFTQPALVNGTVGLVMAPRGRLFLVLGFTITDGKITDIDVVADPARLRQLDLAVLDGRRSAPRPHGVRRGPVAPAVSDRECPRRE
jgi:hypothetical protein